MHRHCQNIIPEKTSRPGRGGGKEIPLIFYFRCDNDRSNHKQQAPLFILALCRWAMNSFNGFLRPCSHGGIRGLFTQEHMPYHCFILGDSLFVYEVGNIPVLRTGEKGKLLPEKFVNKSLLAHLKVNNVPKVRTPSLMQFPAGKIIVKKLAGPLTWDGGGDGRLDRLGRCKAIRERSGDTSSK